MGHEVVGEVSESNASTPAFVPGQRVVFVPGVSCEGMDRSPRCPMCESGLPLLCLNRDDYAAPLSWGAGWSEQFICHQSQLLPIPDDVPDDQAVLLDPIASSAHAVLRRLPVAGDTAIVVGCGAIGLGIIMALRASRIPVRILAVARYFYQREKARLSGADLVFDSRSENLYHQLASALSTDVLSRGGRNRLLKHGASVVYDAVGSGETLHHALRWTRPRGAVVVEGISHRLEKLDRSAIWLREIDILGAHGHGIEEWEGRRLHTFQLVLDWIRERRISPETLVSHKLPLSDYRDAIALADAKANSGAVKVLLEMNYE